MRPAGKRALIFFAVFFAPLFPLCAPPLAAEGIPLLISEHHADHLEFFLRAGAERGAWRAGNKTAALLVLDAHADTVESGQYDRIKDLAARGQFAEAGALVSNHDWIHPLNSFPLASLAWVSVTRGYPRADKLEGFFKSTAAWRGKTAALSLSLDELRFAEIPGGALFVSVDLDFFYSEDYSPRDVPAVLDALFAFSSKAAARRPVVWAICLSRPWLPDDVYAWTLLEEALSWLSARSEFAPPEIALFDSPRVDDSRAAQAYRARGKEPPGLNKADMPRRIKILIEGLTGGK